MSDSTLDDIHLQISTHNNKQTKRKMTGHHAIIFGASGITGWAITNQLLQGYPTPETFSRVTALTNRPLALEDTLWPASDKLLLTQANLMHEGGQEGLEAELKAKVKDIDTVSHVYFFGNVAVA
jgi:hypothetical protein